MYHVRYMTLSDAIMRIYVEAIYPIPFGPRCTSFRMVGGRVKLLSQFYAPVYLSPSERVRVEFAGNGVARHVSHTV
jgi:hypothetical protein